MLRQGKIFGDTFPLEAAGAEGLSPDTLVPGVAVFSRRAEALAAWTSGVELASVSADTDRACLILETGVNDRFRCRLPSSLPAQLPYSFPVEYKCISANHLYV